MKNDVSGGQRSKFKKSEKMLKKEVSGGEDPYENFSRFVADR